VECDPFIAARNRRILELRAEGLKAPMILSRLKAENVEWGSYEVATIRQVVSRTNRRAGMGVG
jgi:hypothetical protein